MHTSPNRCRLWTFLLLAAWASAALPASAQTTTGNLLTNPGAELGTGVEPGTVTGWTVGGTSNPGRDNGTFDPSVSPFDGSYDFYGNGGNSEASGTLTQRVDLLSAGISAARLAAPGNTASFSFFEQSYDDAADGPTDTAGVTLTFLSAAGSQLGTATSGEIRDLDSWGHYTATAPVPVGTRYVDYQIFFVRHQGVDVDSFVDDAALTVTTVPEPSTWAAVLGGVGVLLVVQRCHART